MCGIAGSFAYRSGAQSVSRRALIALRDTMSARGPDGAGLWLSPDSRIGLAHRRLAIIDLSERGAQPMATADGRYHISFNGEIYNYRALRADCEARGTCFVSDSDTEVLLALFALDGVAMLPRLRGMFAFAIWDRDARALTLARDRFGIKPLYYRDSGGQFDFASSAKALQGTHSQDSLDPVAQVGFLVWGSVPEGRTLYANVREVPAGHFLTLPELGPMQLKPWGTVQQLVSEAEQNPFRGARHDAVAACAAAIRDSVAAHTVADVRVGVFLSAGIDSTMIAAALPAQSSALAVTLGFDTQQGTGADEVPVAADVARMLELEQHTRRIGFTDFRSCRPDILSAMDQPTIDGINSWFVSRAATQEGLKMALSGLGGDEIFGSYPSFAQVPRMVRAAGPLRGLPILGRLVRSALARPVAALSSPKYAGLLEYGGTYGGAYLLRRALFMPWELQQLLPRETVEEGLLGLGLPESLDRLLVGIQHPQNRVAMLELSRYMRTQLLRDADWASMAHSLEVRVPLVDDYVVRTVLACRTAYPNISKREVLQSLSPPVEALVGARRKTGFTVPVQTWLQQERPGQAATGNPAGRDRGLRTWARKVLAIQSSSSPVTMTSLAFAPLVSSRSASPQSRRSHRVLISTIAPSGGGVGTMTQFVVEALRRRGLEPVVAHYEPYSLSPHLSVPSYALLARYVGREVRLTFGDTETHAIGAWLPELEFTQYAAHDDWRKVMDSCATHMAVSGNVLPVTAYARTQRPFVAWIASDWQGDRVDRVRQFSAPRRWLDAGINAPVIRAIEKRLLCAGTILPLSEYTRGTLQALAPCDIGRQLLPMPIDIARFQPQRDARVGYTIGFVGRYDDPRKNIGLLFAALGRLRRSVPQARAVVAGGRATDEIRRLAAQYGVEDAVALLGTLRRDQVAELLPTLDVFVVPSHQEGLCIAALEAMACGVPVISTRCGGPEEFVLPGETGDLCGSDPADLAARLQALVGNDREITRLGDAARTLVEVKYSLERAESVLFSALKQRFPSLDVVG